MKICFVADLHLPDTDNTVQYKVLEWMLSDIRHRNVDLVVFAGDYTANGAKVALEKFRDAIAGLEIKTVIIPGNSDYRLKETRDEVRRMASDPLFEQEGCKLIALMDGEGTISEEIWKLLDQLDEHSLVCGHHPPDSLRSPHRERLNSWLNEHPGVLYFCGHKHFSGWVNDSAYLLTAADPDKAIGENPGITYFDTETKQLSKSYFECPVPSDFREYIGLSCRNPEDDIPYAIAHGIRHLEVRSNYALWMTEPIQNLIQQWRKNGGVTLSVHAPDIFLKGEPAYNEEAWVSLITVVNTLSADRITLHVPNIPVGKGSDAYLHDIADHVAMYLSQMPDKLMVGIENMHMTPSEKPDENRRYGYVPEEVLRFISILREHTLHPVGSHLDVGHARNNAPYSQKYPIGSWYRLVGKQVNGYHIHQVIMTEHGMENHMPIDRWYGSLISYASFFREWCDGVLNKAPVFLEIRPKNGHLVTFEMLEQED